MGPTAQIVSSLPSYGAPAERFSATGQGLHAEGLVVEFAPSEAPGWTGSFTRGLTSYDLVEPHPNLRDVVVIAGGQGYVVDTVGRRVKESFGAAIVAVLKHPSRPWLIFNHQDIRFSALGPMGHVWESGRISWDGFRLLQMKGERLSGEAWDLGDSWLAFELDLNTGDFTGGTYPATLLGA